MAKSPLRPRGLNARQRWQAALQERDMLRDELRNNKLHGTPMAKSTVAPTGDLMVRRGTRVVQMTRRDASSATRKSWLARKQKYGKKGRVSKLTFNKTHRRTRS